MSILYKLKRKKFLGKKRYHILPQRSKIDRIYVSYTCPRIKLCKKEKFYQLNKTETVSLNTHFLVCV